MNFDFNFIFFHQGMAAVDTEDMEVDTGTGAGEVATVGMIMTTEITETLSIK